MRCGLGKEWRSGDQMGRAAGDGGRGTPMPAACWRETLTSFCGGVDLIACDAAQTTHPDGVAFYRGWPLAA
jgi:hypothetical protein